MSVKVLAVVATAALCFSATACGGSDKTASSDGSTSGSADEKVNIAAFVLATANAYSQGDINGIKKAVEADGNASLEVFDGGFDGSKQMNQIQDAVVTGKYDAFIVFPNDGAAVTPAVEDAIEDGITVVAAYAPIGNDPTSGEPQVDGLTGLAWVPTLENARATAQSTIDACKTDHADADPCQVGYITGGLALPNEQARLAEFTKIIGEAEQPIDIVAEGEGEFLEGAGHDAAQDMIQAHGDLDVLVHVGDQMAIGSERAIAEAGKEGEITIVADGTTKQGVEAVDEGRWFASTVMLPETEGETAAEMAIAATRGQAPSAFEVNLLDGSPVGPTYTRDDREQGFKPQWSS